MIIIAADLAVAEQVRQELGIFAVHAITDPDALKAAPRQPIVLVTSWAAHEPGLESEKALAFDREMRRAARANGGDTFEVSLPDLQARPTSIMRHLEMFVRTQDVYDPTHRARKGNGGG